MKTKKIIIIQTGKAIKTACDKFGDFDEWFIKSMNIEKNLTKTYRVFEKLEFPDIDIIAGIIITGSSSMVTDKLNWSEATINWLQQFISQDIPILGVCYGHQLLAKLLGGKVGWNPKGRELGQVNMHLTTEAFQDKLLSNVIGKDKTSLKLLASHQQSVIQLPPNSTLLGSTSLDGNHCFRYKKHIWGLQFHPEFTVEITKDYIKARSADILAEGLNPTQMIKHIDNNNYGELIMQNFKDICFK